jgi:methyl-accepting chemotaxis protein
MTKDNRRRNYYIKKLFQLRFILQFTALVVMACAAWGMLVYFYSRQTLTTAFIDSKLRVMSTADFLMPALGLGALLVTALAALAAAARLLFFSHQIAGPLYRLEKTAQEVRDGNLKLQVKLRSGDQLQELAESMDQMVANLRMRTSQIRVDTERLREVVDRAKKVPALPREILQALEETSDQLAQSVSRFQV